MPAASACCLAATLLPARARTAGRGADERDPGLFARSGQFGVLGQEPIAGVDGVCPAVLGYVDQTADVQVGPERVAPFSYLVALVGFLAVERVPVLVGEHGDGGIAQLVDRPEGADRDLTPVGDQHFAHRSERILQGDGVRRGSGASGQGERVGRGGLGGVRPGRAARANGSAGGARGRPARASGQGERPGRAARASGSAGLFRAP